MNDSQWDQSRGAYIAYRDTKRNLDRIYKEHTRTYVRREKARRRYNTAKTTAENNLDDPTQAEKLLAAYKAYQEATSNHDVARKQASHGLRDFKSSEMKYSVILFRCLRQIHGFTLTQIKNLFGVHISSISDWIRGDNEKRLSKLYDDEFSATDAEDDDRE